MPFHLFSPDRPAVDHGIVDLKHGLYVVFPIVMRPYVNPASLAESLSKFGISRQANNCLGGGFYVIGRYQQSSLFIYNCFRQTAYAGGNDGNLASVASIATTPKPSRLESTVEIVCIRWKKGTSLGQRSPMNRTDSSTPTWWQRTLAACSCEPPPTNRPRSGRSGRMPRARLSARISVV